MIGIICPSPKGAKIANEIKDNMECKLYIKGEGDFSLKDVTKDAFEKCNLIIFISSTGIAVRAISKYIVSKDKDPGVVVIDLCMKYAISLLSGHLGGANDLAIRLSKYLNIMPIITTATDGMGITAPDIIAKNNDLVIDDLKIAKYISSLLVDNKKVYVKDDYNILDISKGYYKSDNLKEDSIWVTNNIIYEDNKNLDYKRILKLIKKDIILGIGCRRNTPYEKLKDFIESTLKEYNFHIKSVKKIVSAELKSDEKGIIELSKYLNCPFETFSLEEIRSVHDKYEKSEFVLKTLGVGSVCEPCVDLGNGKVVVNKIKNSGMTLAIGIIN